MRSLISSLTLGAVVLVFVGLTPSASQAQWWRRHHNHAHMHYYYPPATVYYTPPVSYGSMYYSMPTYAPQVPAVRVGLFDNYFEPRTLTVPAGTTVQWTNYGLHHHTITSATGLFDSGELGHDASFSFTFTQPGVYYYYCRIHSQQMRATVVVQ